MIDETDLAEARQALTDQLLDLERRLMGLSNRQLMQGLHSLKGLAQAYGLRVVAGVLHEVESEAGRNAPQAVLIAYLDRAHDALEADVQDDPAYLDQLLATAKARIAA
jgi:chemotaxis protein histidine kinase CheA